MPSEFSADFACGQILFSLKASKLNYVVKETYSAYITLRKKFINTIGENQVPATVDNETANTQNSSCGYLVGSLVMPTNIVPTLAINFIKRCCQFLITSLESEFALYEGMFGHKVEPVPE